jgi:hypothetical protein
VRAANRATDERKKQKDDEKAKWWVRQARLDQGRRWQGLEEEEEE